MKDCEGHEAEDDLNPTSRACKAYVMLCQEGEHHDAYFDDELRDAIVDILADLNHLAEHEGLDFWEMVGVANGHALNERREWLRLVKATCIAQLVELNREGAR